jgi:hypothetical protein
MMVKGKTKTTKSSGNFMQQHIKRHVKKGMGRKRAEAAGYIQ